MTKKIISSLLAIIIMVLLVSCASPKDTDVEGSTSAAEDSVPETDTYVVTSGDFGVSLDMFEYWFNQIYISYVDSDSYDLDAKDDISTMIYDIDTGETWYEMIQDTTKTKVQQLLTIYVAAENNGVDYEDIIESKISSHIDSLESIAETNGQDMDLYLQLTFGADVTEDTIRKCDAIDITAELYRNSTKNSFDITDDEIDSFFQNEPDSISRISYVGYTFTSEDIGSTALARNYAEQLYNSSSEKDFQDTLYSILVETDPTNADKEESELLADYKADDVVNNSDGSGSGFTDWAFDDEREYGETYKTYKEASGIYSVYMVVEGPDDSSPLTGVKYYDTYITKTVRSIQTDSSDTDAVAAVELMADFIDAGGTEQNFIDIANEYDSFDEQSGGLVENATKDEISSEDALDWIYSDERTYGDYTVVDGDDYSYFIYFVSDGSQAWYSQAESSIIDEKYTETFDSWSSLYPVSFSDEISNISLAPLYLN